MAILETIQVHNRFCGPPDSGNGGYVCGRVANHLDGDAEVTLLKPPPLDTDLFIRKDGDAILMEDAQGTLIANGKPAAVTIEAPAAPDFKTAVEASKGSPRFDSDTFDTCFVCGPKRQDGLRIFAGSIGGSDLFASPWVPSEDLVGKDGLVDPTFLWAALDCPGAFAIGSAAINETGISVVLGRFKGRITGSLKPGEKCVVAAWKSAENDGRKHFAGSAVYGENGQLAGLAEATWIELR